VFGYVKTISSCPKNYSIVFVGGSKVFGFKSTEIAPIEKRQYAKIL